jgi:nitrate reductase NapD
MNISSAIVYAKPMQDEELCKQLCALDGVEVHASTDDGKIIVTIECANDLLAIDTYKAIEHLSGVLSVAMIFQQSESNPSSSS